MSLLGILNYVNGTLEADTDVSDIVGNNIFPNIVPDFDGDGQVTFPLIVMDRQSVEPVYTKTDGCRQDNVSVAVTCWSVSYEECVDLAEKVLTALEFQKGDVNGVVVDRCRLASADEGFEEVAYYQRLIFNFK